eukprot:205923-Lingulodinium_polyedra.AAC.1
MDRLRREWVANAVPHFVCVQCETEDGEGVKRHRREMGMGPFMDWAACGGGGPGIETAATYVEGRVQPVRGGQGRRVVLRAAA